ncbi:PREDICTED: guanylate-binding protein 7-like, partial [Galeopterus variegatus]|uniref:Guanylate-binding protein 7-like n=1 Tax=Galeopterus variegatus TaxID=482537 RepID=A0ABM0Q4E9_GALVR
DTIEKKKEDFSLQNEEASVTYCQAELKQLAEPLMERISRGTFSVPGGHNLFLEAKKKVEQDYKLVPRKGVKLDTLEVIRNVSSQNKGIELGIRCEREPFFHLLKNVIAYELTERARREAAEKEQELLREKQKEQQQMMEALQRSYQENLAQLKEKMEQESENLLREQERMLEHKVKVQEELLKEGFKEKSEGLHREVDHLRKEIESTKKNWVSKFFDVAGDACMIILPLPGKLVGAGLKVLSKLTQ